MAVAHVRVALSCLLAGLLVLTIGCATQSPDALDGVDIWMI